MRHKEVRGFKKKTIQHLLEQFCDAMEAQQKTAGSFCLQTKGTREYCYNSENMPLGPLSDGLGVGRSYRNGTKRGERIAK